MSKLRLGPVIDEKPVKLTVEISGALLRDLTDYARIHARLNSSSEPLLPERLIPPMIQRFIAADREFSKQRRRG